MTNIARIRDFLPQLGYLPTGKHNAITDVIGVRVGHVTRIEGDDNRTGITAILPHSESVFAQKIPASVHTINGFGKSVGFEQVRELGQIETPILLTNTLNVGQVSDALVSYMLQQNPTIWSVNPLVGETNDSILNDIHARVIQEEDVFAVLENAHGGEVTEGCVGAGTGTSCYQFKGGIGTSSRLVGDYTIGALVQTNFGKRTELRIDGIPVGRELSEANLPELGGGSIMIVLATDAPLTARQLLRLAKRATFGMARTGTVCHHGSGDFVIAFSTQNRVTDTDNAITQPVQRYNETQLNGLFAGVVESVEEAIYNALVSATTITGRNGHTLHALPHDALRQLIVRYTPA
jgi:D-aminopeptidase